MWLFLNSFWLRSAVILALLCLVYWLVFSSLSCASAIDDWCIRRRFVNVYKNLRGGSKEDGAVLLSVVPKQRTRGNGHKMKYAKFHVNTGKLPSYCSDGWTLEQVSQRGCGASIPGDTKTLIGHGLGQPALSGLVQSRILDYKVSRWVFNLNSLNCPVMFGIWHMSLLNFSLHVKKEQMPRVSSSSLGHRNAGTGMQDRLWICVLGAWWLVCFFLKQAGSVCPCTNKHIGLFWVTELSKPPSVYNLTKSYSG